MLNPHPAEALSTSSSILMVHTNNICSLYKYCHIVLDFKMQNVRSMLVIIFFSLVIRIAMCCRPLLPLDCRNRICRAGLLLAAFSGWSIANVAFPLLVECVLLSAVCTCSNVTVLALGPLPAAFALRVQTDNLTLQAVAIGAAALCVGQESARSLLLLRYCCYRHALCCILSNLSCTLDFIPPPVGCLLAAR